MSGNTEKFDLKQMEKWLENFFLDPLTSYLDETMFRVDIFETEKEYILEALLLKYKSTDITVYLMGSEVQIKAKQHGVSNEFSRFINLPFTVVDKQVHATFVDGILEIFISKDETGLGKNRFVTLR